MKAIALLLGGILSTSTLALDARAWDLNIQTDLAHQYGSFNGMWHAPPSVGPQGPFMTYGTSGGWMNDNGQEVAIMTTFNVSPVGGQSINTVWDILEGNTTIFKRTYTTAVTTRFEASAVVRLATHWFQPRTRANAANGSASGWVDQGNVQIYMEYLDKTKDIWPGIEQAGYHQVGALTGAADWVAGPGKPGCNPNCNGKFMTFGPYVSESYFSDQFGYFPHYLAIFHLQTNSGAASTAPIADVEVVYTDAYNNTVYLASRALTGADFPANNVMTGIALKFDVPYPSPVNIQFRTRMRSSTALVTQSDTKILKAI